MDNGKKKDGKRNTIFIADKGDELRNEATVIAEFWKESTGNIVSFSIQDVVRILVKSYHKSLQADQPQNVDFNNLFKLN